MFFRWFSSMFFPVPEEPKRRSERDPPQPLHLTPRLHGAQAAEWAEQPGAPAAAMAGAVACGWRAGGPELRRIPKTWMKGERPARRRRRRPGDLRFLDFYGLSGRLGRRWKMEDARIWKTLPDFRCAKVGWGVEVWLLSTSWNAKRP